MGLNEPTHLTQSEFFASMNKKILVLSLVSVIFFSGLAFSQSNQTAVDYLKSKDQNAWTVMALAGAGQENISSYLTQVSFEGTSATDYAKYILALAAAGQNPSDFDDKNFVGSLRDSFDETSNQFGDANYISEDIWAILALGSIGKEYLPEAQAAQQFILDNQNTDGGWSFGLAGNTSSADMTAAVIMALLESGITSDNSIIVNAKNYLDTVQNSDGGFPGWTGDSSASSDAWVISAIYKLGEDPVDWLKDGKNPIEHLESLQDSEKGFFYDTQGGAGEDSFVSARTAYAVIALSGKAYPVATPYNQHRLRMEGIDATVCDEYINGGTVLDLVIEGAKSCNFTYLFEYYESFDSFLITEINGEQNWEYKVNEILPMVGADNFYLEPGDEALWYGVGSLWGTWVVTEVEVFKTEALAQIQVNVGVQGLKVKVGSAEFFTDSQGRIELSLNSFTPGFYQVFVESQILEETGYTRSEKVSLKVGETPSEHGAGLKVEIEQVEVGPGGGQSEISFSVSPDMLDFGKLKTGESSTQNVTIINGSIEIYLEAEVAGAGVFQDNLHIEQEDWQMFSAGMSASQEETWSVGLTIPANYNGNFGLMEGELTFWAIQQ